MLGSPYLSTCGRLGSWCGCRGLDQWSCLCLSGGKRKEADTCEVVMFLVCEKEQNTSSKNSKFQVPKKSSTAHSVSHDRLRKARDCCGSQEFVARGSTPRRTTRAKVLNSSDTVSRGSTPRSTHLRGTHYVPETLALDQRGATPCSLGDPVGI